MNSSRRLLMIWLGLLLSVTIAHFMAGIVKPAFGLNIPTVLFFVVLIVGNVTVATIWIDAIRTVRWRMLILAPLIPFPLLFVSTVVVLTFAWLAYRTIEYAIGNRRHSTRRDEEAAS